MLSLKAPGKVYRVSQSASPPGEGEGVGSEREDRRRGGWWMGKRDEEMAEKGEKSS